MTVRSNCLLGDGRDARQVDDIDVRSLGLCGPPSFDFGKRLNDLIYHFGWREVPSTR